MFTTYQQCRINSRLRHTLPENGEEHEIMEVAMNASENGEYYISKNGMRSRMNNI